MEECQKFLYHISSLLEAFGGLIPYIIIIVQNTSLDKLGTKDCKRITSARMLKLSESQASVPSFFQTEQTLTSSQ